MSTEKNRTPEHLKKYIDAMSYEEMLCLWRNAPSGHELLQGEVGTYFSEVMNKKKQTADHVSASKSIGWEG